MRGLMRGAVLLVGTLCIAAFGVAVDEAEALGVVLNSQQLTDIINNEGNARMHKLVVSCSGDALVHDLRLSVWDDDISDSYQIFLHSVTVGHETVGNHPYTFEPGGGVLDLVRWANNTGGLASYSYPLVLAESLPLVVPVHVVDIWGNSSAVAHLDMAYAAGPGTVCALRPGLDGPQVVGLVVPGEGPLAKISADIEAATHLGVEDFNAYLSDTGETWTLEITTAHDGADPVRSFEAVAGLHEGGVSVLLGLATDDALAGARGYIHNGGMMAISCCSGSESLALPDRIFRLAPDDMGDAEAMAGLLDDDRISLAVLVHDEQGAPLKDALVGHLAGKIDVAVVPYGAGVADAADVAQQMLLEIRTALDVHGTEGTGVVVMGSGNVLDIFEASSVHETLREVRWYGLGVVVGLVDLTVGDLGEFSRDVRLAGVQPDIAQVYPSGEISEKLRLRTGTAPGDDMGLHVYSAYDAVWILGRTMMTLQTANPETLAGALPIVARYHQGTAGGLDLDENGDVAVSYYGIWRIVAGDWTRVGTYSQLDQSVWYQRGWEDLR